MKRFPKLYQIGLRFPKTVLVCALVLSVLAFWQSSKLKVESDLTALLPSGTPSVQNLNLMNRYFGGSSLLFLTAEAPDPELAQRFADDFAARVEAHPSVLYVESKRPVEYFKKRQWLYLDIEDLQEMERRVDRALDLERQGVNSLFSEFMNFTDADTLPDLSFRDIIDKYKKKGGIDLKDRTSSDDGTFVILKIKAKDDAEDMDSSRRLLADIRGFEVSLKRDIRYQSVQVGYTGGYVTKIEQVDAITRKMVVISLAITSILMLILLVYFRRVSAVCFIGIPILASLVWTGGFVYLILGHLNMVTGFGAAILSGIGSDYGVFLLSRYYQERESGCGFVIACDRTFSKTGRATHASMVTAVGAFIALIFSRFGIFREFGVVGVAGILTSYIAMMIMIPSLLALWERHGGAFSAKHFSPHFFARILKTRAFAAHVPMLFSRRAAGLGIACIIGLTTLSASTLREKTRISFSSGQMDNKALPGNRLYSRVSAIVGNTLSPTVLIVRGYDEAKNVVSAFDDASRGPLSSYFKMVLGLPSFVPDGQLEKGDVLKRIHDKFKRLHLPKSDKRNAFLESLKDSAKATPITRDELPHEVTRSFVSSRDPNLFAVYLFPAIDRTVQVSIDAYRAHIQSIRDFLGLHFAEVDGNFVTADTVSLIKHEAPQRLFFLFLFLGLVLLVVIPSKRRSALILVLLVDSLVLLSGLLWLTGTELNILNIATISIALGTGIDSFIHFSHRYDETHDLWATVKSKTPAIIASNLTTAVGFAGLLFTSNAGLVSIGTLAILGLGVVTFTAIVTFPHFLAFSRGASRNKSQPLPPRDMG